MKKSDIILIITLLLGGLFISGRTVYIKVHEKNFIIEELQNTNKHLISMIDSLVVTNNLLEEYYMATENLLDSIFVRYCWPDAIDSYEYYKSIENIESIYPKLYNYMEECRHN